MKYHLSIVFASIDAIGGWTTTGVGQRHGIGQSLEVKAKWMDRLVDQD